MHECSMINITPYANLTLLCKSLKTEVIIKHI